MSTAQRIKQRLQHMLELRGMRLYVRVVANPEFHQEGCAVNDCMRPDRIIIIGVDDHQDVVLFREFTSPSVATMRS